MRHFILFELKKAFKSQKNWILLLIFCLIAILFSANNMKKNDDEISETINHCRLLARWYEVRASTYESRYEKDGVDLYKQCSIASKERSEAFKRKLKALKSGNKKEELKAEIDYLNAQLKYYNYGIKSINSGNIDIMYPFILGYPIQLEEGVKYYEAQLDFYHTLESKNILPMNRYEMTGINFLYTCLHSLFPSFLIIYLMILLADIISQENDMGSFKFLLLQPYKRGKILVSKVMASFIIAIIGILIPLSVAFIMNCLMNGVGSLQYPVLETPKTYQTLDKIPNQDGYDRAYYLQSLIQAENTVLYKNFDMKYDTACYGYDMRYENFYMGISEYTSERMDYAYYVVPSDKYEFISIASFITKTIPIVLFIIIFAVVFALLISTLMKNSMLSMVVCMIIGFLSLLSRYLPDTWKIKDYLPFSFTDSVGLINGLGTYSFLSAVFVLSISTIFLLVLNWFCFRKQDIVC